VPPPGAVVTREVFTSGMTAVSTAVASICITSLRTRTTRFVPELKIENRFCVVAAAPSVRNVADEKVGMFVCP
jgi:hypothetical protein